MILFSLSKPSLNELKLNPFPLSSNPLKKSFSKIEVDSPNNRKIFRTQHDFFITSNHNQKNFANHLQIFHFV